MENKKIITIMAIAVGVLVLALVGLWVYSLINQNFSFENITGNPAGNTPSIKTLTVDETKEILNRDYPETITGIVKFSKGDTETVKVTITTGDGKEYTLSPDQPAFIYGSYGVKDGNKVQIQGRFTSDNKIEWTSIKAI